MSRALDLRTEAEALPTLDHVFRWALHHRPTPDELLDARLEAGWKPTPSVLQSGDAILGHAACRFT